MARTPKKLAPAPGVLLSLDAAKKLRAKAGSLVGKTAPLQLGWEPNDCYHCEGTGYIPGKRKRAVHYCHACGGLGKGPQAKALLRREKEVFFGGSKGGGKTDCMSIWMVSGNPHQPNFNQNGAPIQHNQTYISHPNFRGLVIRKNVGDLKAWISTAKKYYRKLGGEYINGEFRFPAGATIWVGHMDDDDSWMKYQGAPELHRVGWEEICQIRNRDSYMHMISCVRTTTPGLRAQLFLTGNPIGPGFCVPYGEVLTPGGWVNIESMNVGDSVYTVNKRGELVEATVDQTHAAMYAGDLFVTDVRGLHMAVTPDHKIAYVPTPKNPNPASPFQLRKAKYLPRQTTVLRTVEWSGQTLGVITINRLPGRRKHQQPLQLPGNDYAELIGWFLSEGSVVPRDRAFSIAQCNETGRTSIKKLLDRCGFIYSTSAKGYTIYSPEWYEHFAPLGRSWQKRIPTRLLSAPKKELSRLLIGLMDGDGAWGRGGSHRSGNRFHWKRSGTYYTSSKGLADDVSEILLKLGFIVKGASRQRLDTAILGNQKKSPLRRSFEVAFKTCRQGGTVIRTGSRRYNVKEEGNHAANFAATPYCGPVYCIGVADTNTFVIRQKGTIWVSGNSWVRDRFVSVKNKKGELIPPGTPIRQIVKHPVTGEDIQMGRIFIPAGLRDNPHLMKDPEYVGSLMQLPTQLRKAYLDGDWSAMGGNFFREFRPEGALASEPPQANHCVGPRNTAARQRKGEEPAEWIGQYPELKPWWPRIIGGDWGFSHNSAFYWGAVDPSTGLNHIYRERIYNQTSIEEVGFEIAKASREDLIALPGKAMTLYFSRDAFDSRNRYIDGSTSFVEMFRDGMEKAIGLDAVHIPQFEPENRDELLPMHAMKDFDGAYRDYQAQVSAQRESGITVVKAMTSRVVGAQLIREVMKWTPPIMPNQQGIDWEVYTKIAMEYGMNQAAKYQLEHTPAPISACPRVLIWEEACPHLIQALTVAQHDRKNAEDVERDHWKGADSYDAFRYCLNGMEAAASLDPPYEETRAKEKEELMAQNPQATVPDMIWMEMHLDNEKRASEAMLRAPVGRDATRHKRAARGRFKRKLAGRTN